MVSAVAAAACSSQQSTQLEQPPTVAAGSTLADLAVAFAKDDGKSARKSVYLSPLQQLQRRCSNLSVAGIETEVRRLGVGIAKELSAPYATAEAALAAASLRRSVTCTSLASRLLREVVAPVPQTNIGWGGYAGTLAAWQRAHRASSRAFNVSGPGRVFTLVRRFSPPVTSQLALASIEHSLLPGTVHVVYALKAAQCQQAIFMGTELGRRFGNASLGAFVELTSGNGVGHTPYDANRVDRARITPLGRIGGQPCT